MCQKFTVEGSVFESVQNEMLDTVVINDCIVFVPIQTTFVVILLEIFIPFFGGGGHTC